MRKGLILMFVLPCMGGTLTPQDLVTRFQAAYEKYSPLDLSGRSKLDSNFTLTFGILKEDVHGKCGFFKSGRLPPTVVLSVFDWEKSTDVRREIVVFHELGHCLLKRDHRLDIVERNGKIIPASMMYPGMIQIEIGYEENRDYYLEELFFHKDDPASELGGQ